jgi:hypothetical protein
VSIPFRVELSTVVDDSVGGDGGIDGVVVATKEGMVHAAKRALFSLAESHP